MEQRFLQKAVVDRIGGQMKLLQKSGSKNGLSSIDITREEVRATNKEPRKGLLTKNIRDEDETPKSEAAAVAAAEAPTPSLLVCFFCRAR